ncbi:winged helix-turn-helix transcriptional regulator [Dyella humicola]|uniref:winged helix-turn-helix transcriptional regulator n=1 Tax=Dyella humicola TaxID=2992126 RepID=UPI002257B7D6|nr:helix-turn-helix domain-containing protein [Dyella humicola]
MRRVSLMEATCPIARALDEIGDWWTLLIVRDAFGGMTRFSEFQKSLGLAKNILSERLRTLVANGVLEKRPAADGGARSEYHLTEKGRQLRVILFALRQWGEDHLFEEGEEMMLARDRGNLPIARLSLVNAAGESLAPDDIVVAKGHKRKRVGRADGQATLA